MADLSITASQVIQGSIDAGADFYTGIAAATILQGQTCYVNASNQVALADADASALTAATKGIAITGASAGQKVMLQTAGLITLGAAASMTIGVSYFQSPVAGGIGARAEVLTADYVTYLGTATTAAILSMHIHITGAVSA